MILFNLQMLQYDTKTFDNWEWNENCFFPHNIFQTKFNLDEKSAFKKNSLQAEKSAKELVEKCVHSRAR